MLYTRQIKAGLGVARGKMNKIMQNVILISTWKMKVILVGTGGWNITREMPKEFMLSLVVRWKDLHQEGGEGKKLASIGKQRLFLLMKKRSVIVGAGKGFINKAMQIR